MSEYEKNVNDLIPTAITEADNMVLSTKVEFIKRKGVDGKDYNHCMWSEHFHRAMNRLTREAGIRTI